jgi:uncharacterized GH25 family protein
MRLTRSVPVALLLMAAVAGDAFAHYTYVVPQSFRVSAGDTVVVGFHSGDGFPESSAVLKRLQEPTIHTGRGRLKVDGLKEDGKRLVASVHVPASGHVIVTAVNGAAIEEMKPESFEKYLEEEGLGHIVRARAERGESDKPGKERYTMYAKTIFVVGAPSDAYRTVVGLPLEIVPEKDPYRLQAGESLPVRVLLRGAPAASLEIKATSAGGTTRIVGKTDSSGRLNVPVSRGQWRLHAIHMDRGSDVDWESVWTTLTFEIS